MVERESEHLSQSFSSAPQGARQTVEARKASSGRELAHITALEDADSANRFLNESSGANLENLERQVQAGNPRLGSISEEHGLTNDRDEVVRQSYKTDAPAILTENKNTGGSAFLLSRGYWKERLGALGARILPWVPERLASFGYQQMNRWWPSLARQLRKVYSEALEPIDAKIHPYRGLVPTFDRIPQQGRASAEIIDDIHRMLANETSKWERGYVSGAVYSGDRDHIALLAQVYALSSQMNPLHADIWPSCVKFEAEIVRMTASMLHGGPNVCGVVTSGGTESILLACKTYRDWGRAQRNISRPEVIIPSSAHAAFHKAADYFGIRLRIAAVDPETFQVKVAHVRKLLSRNTVLIVGSAPQFPHGVIDPIPDLAEIARKRRIGLHVDACLGGFILPWAEKLQKSRPDAPHLQSLTVPIVDFRIPGVTSISVDTHKYGFAAKGTSVILYASPEWRRYQFYTLTDWSGGLYFSPTLAGSRPGGLIAACWAAMLRMGEDGYLDAADRILRAAHKLKSGIRETIPELRILGEPLWVIAFAAAEPATLDIYRVLDAMTERGWSLNGLHRPACIHICVTLRHCEHGVIERFLCDLKECVRAGLHSEEAGEAPRDRGMAPVYGMGGTMPARGVVADLLLAYMDLLYKV